MWNVPWDSCAHVHSDQRAAGQRRLFSLTKSRFLPPQNWTLELLKFSGIFVKALYMSFGYMWSAPSTRFIIYSVVDISNTRSHKKLQLHRVNLMLQELLQRLLANITHRELSSNGDKLFLVPTTAHSERRRLGKVGKRAGSDWAALQWTRQAFFWLALSFSWALHAQVNHLFLVAFKTTLPREECVKGHFCFSFGQHLLRARKIFSVLLAEVEVKGKF